MKSLYDVVGMKYRGMLEFVASLPNGERLLLIRDSKNDFDQNAVQVWARDRHVGFIRATQARSLAVRMDRSPAAEVTGLLVKRGHGPMIEVEE